MNMLPTTAMRAVVEHDQAKHPYGWGLPNRTRFYKYLLPAENDMEVHTVACKCRRDGEVVAKEVVRASVDDPFVYVTDLAHVCIAGYVVDWSREKLGKPKAWGYRGRWESAPFAPRGKWILQCEVINPEALVAHPRFRYCAWTPDCGEITKYLKVFKQHPRVELLAKAGCGRFGRCGGFARQMESNKALARFFMENVAAIRAHGYGVDVIRRAFRDGCKLDDAAQRISDRRVFRYYHLPCSIDASKAREYCRLHKTSEYDYAAYARDVVRLGLALDDTKNAFPRNFGKRRRIVADMAAEMTRRQKVEVQKAMDPQIAATAKKWARFERNRATLRVVLPRKADDLIREGMRLHNCLGDGHYAAKMARGETVIAFIRRSDRPGKAFVAVEWSVDQKRVLQCYADRNGRPPAEVRRFVDKWFVNRKRVA